MLAAGVELPVAGFAAEPTGEIHDSVPWFFARCLPYAGSVFGAGIYVNSKFGHPAGKLRNSLTRRRERAYLREQHIKGLHYYRCALTVFRTLRFI